MEFGLALKEAFAVVLPGFPAQYSVPEYLGFFVGRTYDRRLPWSVCRRAAGSEV